MCFVLLLSNHVLVIRYDKDHIHTLQMLSSCKRCMFAGICRATGLCQEWVPQGGAVPPRWLQRPLVQVRNHHSPPHWAALAAMCVSVGPTTETIVHVFCPAVVQPCAAVHFLALATIHWHALLTKVPIV